MSKCLFLNYLCCFDGAVDDDDDLCVAHGGGNCFTNYCFVFASQKVTCICDNRLLGTYKYKNINN